MYITNHAVCQKVLARQNIEFYKNREIFTPEIINRQILNHAYFVYKFFVKN